MSLNLPLTAKNTQKKKKKKQEAIFLVFFALSKLNPNLFQSKLEQVFTKECAGYWYKKIRDSVESS